MHLVVCIVLDFAGENEHLKLFWMLLSSRSQTGNNLHPHKQILKKTKAKNNESPTSI
jgi:hypothetical protein